MINIKETNYKKIESLVNFLKENDIDFDTKDKVPKNLDIDPLSVEYPIWHKSDLFHRKAAFARFYFNGKKNVGFWNVVRHCGSHIKAEKLYLEAQENNRKDLVRHLEDILNESK